jgi:spermidine synthase
MDEKKASYSSSGKIATLVLVCFFLSGLTGLIYEILWTRMIVKVIGTAPFAISIVLTVFMAGLGLGSYIASRTIDRVKDHLKLVRIYGVLELIVGGYCLVLPVLLKGFLPIYSVVYNHLFKHFMLYNLLTFVGCSVLLIIPVTCMGATLPVLCRFYVNRLSHLGTHAGRLYGLNTIGAAAGALLCGFWLIAILGVYGTLALAVMLNAAIGIVSIAASYRIKTEDRSQKTEDGGQKAEDGELIYDSAYKGATTVALIIFAVSGFCAMAYEVIWTKLLGLLIGPTTYSFTIVLVTFITVLALGSMVFGWLADRVKSPVNLLVYTQILAGVFALFVSHILGNSQFFFAKLIYHFQNNFALLHILKAGTLFLFMFFPTFCLGATFPLVCKIYTRSLSKVGGSIGFAYTINTVGAVLGSFCAGFFLIPFLGKENSLRLVTGVQMLTALVLAAYLLLANKQNKLTLAPIGALVVLGLALCVYFPSWNRTALSIGRYHRMEEIIEDVQGTGWVEALWRGSRILGRKDIGRVVYYGDGIGGFTTVLKAQDVFGNVNYSLVNSGKADASSRVDMPTQTLLAHFPMIFYHNPKSVMVLGLASGITAGETLYYPIEKLDVLEISPEVVAASRFFDAWNNNVLSDPRTELIIQDARAHLQLTRRRYDVIISEPSNPWMAGLASLFTREFFGLIRDRLTDTGIFCQWLHSYQMDWNSFALVGRTFSEVFPNCLLVSASPSGVGYDYLLIGLKDTEYLSPAAAERNLPFIQRSKNVKIADAKLLYRLIVSEDSGKLFGVGTVNTDSRPSLEFAAPKLMYQSDETIAKNIDGGKQLRPETASVVGQVTTDVESQIDFAVFALSVYAPFPEMVDLSNATAAQKERFYGLIEQYCIRTPVNYSALKDEELTHRCRLIQIQTIEANIGAITDREKLGPSYFYLADLCYNENILDKCIEYYKKYLEFGPDRSEVHYNMAQALITLGRNQEAIEQLNKALELSPGSAKAHSSLGYTFASMNKLDEAVVHFKEALRLEPKLETARTNLGLAFFRQGKLDDAISQYTEALQTNPDSAKLHRHLASAFLSENKLDKAVEHYNEALRLEPESADTHNSLGAVFVRRGELDKAAEQFTKALEIKPDFVEARNNLGAVLMESRKLDEAVENYNKALQIKPDAADVHCNLAIALVMQNKFEQAIAHFNEALRTRPDYAEAHYELGHVFARIGRFDAAIRHFEEVLRIRPDYPGAGKSLMMAQQMQQRIKDKPSGPRRPGEQEQAVPQQ